MPVYDPEVRLSDDGQLTVFWPEAYNGTGSQAGLSFIQNFSFEPYDPGTVALDITVALADTDGSETLTAVTLAGLPGGFTLTDGTNTATSDGTAPIDITGWTLDAITITPADGFAGTVTIDVAATSTESSNGDQATATETVTVTIDGNNGVPQFSANQAASGTIDRPHAVLVEDIDGDGDQDILVAATIDDRLVWLENDGSEVFTQRNLPADLNGAFELTIADLDEDGDLDLVGVAFDDIVGADVIWYDQQVDPVTGERTFVSNQVNTIDLSAAHSVEVADIDGVGGLDIVVAAQGNNAVYWFANDGAENFTDNTVDTGLADVRISDVGDIDGDGDIDVVSAVQGAGQVVWHENDGAGNFASHVVGAAADANSVVVADIDGDGNLDIASADSGQNMVKVFYNNDDGAGAALSFSETLVFDHLDVDLFSIAADDVDGDGDVDLMSAARTSGEIFWYAQQDDGSWITETVFDGTGQFIDVGSGDVDGDGDTDIVGADQSGDIVYWFENDIIL